MDSSIQNWLFGLLISNLAAIFGAYVSLRVQVAKLEVKVDASEKDINNIGRLMRDKIFKQGE